LDRRESHGQRLLGYERHPPRIRPANALGTRTVPDDLQPAGRAPGAGGPRPPAAPAHAARLDRLRDRLVLPLVPLDLEEYHAAGGAASRGAFHGTGPPGIWCRSRPLSDLFEPQKRRGPPAYASGRPGGTIHSRNKPGGPAS